jgi:sigma-E factor negative regulatory protein RseC
MMEEKALVIAIHDNVVTVQSTIKSTCSSCHQADNCGSGQVAKAIPHKKLVTQIKTTKALSIGDEVILGIPEKDILQTAGQVYLLPLVGLIVFSGLGQWLLLQHIIKHELLAIVLGAAGGYLGYYCASYIQKHRKSAQWLKPKIVRVLPQSIAIRQLSLNK